MAIDWENMTEEERAEAEAKIQEAEQLKANATTMEAENQRLKDSVTRLESLKGSMGRELGDIRRRQEQLEAKTVQDQTSTKDKVDKLVDDPDGYIAQHVLNAQIPLTQSIDRLQNAVNYFITADKHPEYKDSAFQQEVLLEQGRERDETGREISTFEAIEKIKLKRKQEELDKREKVLDESSQVLGEEKIGATAGAGQGIGSSGGPITKRVPTPEETIKQAILKSKPVDSAPF